MLLCLFSTSSARAEPDITTGLVGWWKLDETSGTTAFDSSGNGNDGTLSGGVTFQPTGVVSGGAAQFDGVDGRIDLGNIDVTTGDITLIAWIKADTFNTNDPSVISKADGVAEANYYWSLRFPSGAGAQNIQSRIKASGTTDTNNSTGTVSTGSWVYVAITYDQSATGSEISYYINGALDSTDAHTLGAGAMDSNAIVPVAIGNIPTAAGGERPFDGLIDDVRIYNRALSAEDIAYLYESREGNIKYDTDARVPKFFDGDNWQSMTGGGPYIPNGVYFDSASTYLQQSAALTGVTDGKQGTLSVWFKMDGVDGFKRMFRNSSSRFTTWFETANGGQIVVRGENTASNGVLEMATTNFNSDTSGWHHLLASWDLTDPAKRHLYLDGVDDLDPVNHTTHTDDFIEYSAAYYRIGAKDIASEMWQGGIADLWVSTDTYIDLSVPANREKFITSSGNPVYLGPSGEYPTGTAPAIFLSGDTATWHVNDGAGGGFTENGALTDATTKPADVYYSSAPISGLIGHWKLDETSGTVAADSTGNMDVSAAYFADFSTDSVSGVLGRALNTYDSVYNGLESTPYPASYIATGAFTVSAWVKLQDTSGNSAVMGLQGYMQLWKRHNGAGLALETEGWGSPNGTANSSVSLPVDEWAHVAVTYDYNDAQGTLPKFYLNGVLDGSTWWATSPAGSYTAPTPGDISLAMRWDSAASAFKGVTDDIRYYNRVLSATEIAQLYNQGVCANPTRINGTIIYNADNHIMQYCDAAQSGNGWQAIGSAIGTGTGGCSNPTKAEGSLIFNKDIGVMQYCDGDDWIGVGSAHCPTYPRCGGSATEKLAFVTYPVDVANLGSIPGADAHCQSYADSYLLDGTYYAWIAGTDPASAPATRFVQSSVPYVMTDGTQIAANWADLVDGALAHTLDVEVNGLTAGTTNGVFSNVSMDGTQKGSAASDSCNDWSDNTGGQTGSIGSKNTSDSRWTDNGGTTCSPNYRIYCFEQ